MLCEGRQYGGCVILWNRELVANITLIESFSKRVCAIKYKRHDNFSALIFNVYMSSNTDYCKHNEHIYVEVPNEISSISSMLNYDYLIIAGYYNTDFSRLRPLHTKALVSFMEREELVNPLIELPGAAVYYTFETKANACRSSVDHILVTRNLTRYVQHYVSVHDRDNFSDHAALKLVMQLPCTYAQERKSDSPPAPVWSAASPEDISKLHICAGL